MSRRSDILGAILAGGKSARMGTEKALLPVMGRPMIEFAVETLSSVFSEVIIAGDRGGQLSFLELPIAPDLFEGCGPMAGIHAALSHSKPRPVFVLSCDTPFIPSELVDYVLSFKADALTKIAAFDGEIQPLCGLYDVACLPILERDLQRGKYSVVRTLVDTDHTVVPITPDLAFYTPQMFRNVNRPEDYRSIPTSSRGKSRG